MTKVARLFEEEKQQAIKQAVEKERRQLTEQTAKNLLKNGVSIEIILNTTFLTREEIEKLQEEL